jgi:hypothetical protein
LKGLPEYAYKYNKDPKKEGVKLIFYPTEAEKGKPEKTWERFVDRERTLKRPEPQKEDYDWLPISKIMTPENNPHPILTPTSTTLEPKAVATPPVTEVKDGTIEKEKEEDETGEEVIVTTPGLHI